MTEQGWLSDPSPPNRGLTRPASDCTQQTISSIHQLHGSGIGLYVEATNTIQYIKEHLYSGFWVFPLPTNVVSILYC